MSLKRTLEDMPIAWKGLFLVAIPIAFELLFLFLLFSSLNQSIAELQKAARAKAIVERLQVLDWLLSRTIGAVASYLLTGNSQWEDSLKKCKADRDRIGQELGDLLKNDPKSLERLEFCDEKIEVVNALIQRGKVLIDRGEMRKVLPLFLKNRELLRASTKQLREIEIKYKTLSERSGSVVARARLQLLVFTGFGIFISVITGVLLARFFGSSIGSRLYVLNENTSRYANSEVLGMHLSGNDEIGMLDRMFWRMTAEIDNARRKERAIIDNAVDAIFSLNQSLQFVLLNNTASALWGFDSDELKGRSFTDIVSENERERVLAHLESSIADGDEKKFECTIVRSDLRLAEFVVSVRWSPEDWKLYCIAHDVSEQKKLERLRQQFVKILSQDLRRPLNAIRTGLCSLQNDYSQALGERGKKIVSNSEKSAQRLLELVDDLLKLETMQEGSLALEIASLPISEIVDRGVAAVEEFAGKEGIKIEIKNSDMLVKADAGRIVQVLVNLLSNAIKFSPKNGLIQVEAEREGDFMVVRVIDQGRGVPEDMREKIFERFQQVERADASVKGGFGLGLPICKTIMEDHGGGIGCDSEPGKGSTFWFRLPLSST